MACVVRRNTRFVATFAAYYKILFYEEVLRARVTGYSAVDLTIAALGVLFVLEATRRTVGMPIVVMATLAILYALFGNLILALCFLIPASLLSRCLPTYGLGKAAFLVRPCKYRRALSSCSCFSALF